MVKAGLVILGILILLGAVFFLQIVISPNDQSDIRTAEAMCTAEVEVFGINLPVGRAGQEILGVQEECRNNHYLFLLINYGWIAYVFGGLLLLFGLILGNTKVVYKKRVIHRQQNTQEKSHGKSLLKDKKAKFCGDCGSKLGGYEKYCHQCGRRI